jgi:hypothetical protein
MRPDCEAHQVAILEGRGTAEDAEHCDGCHALFVLERTLARERAFPIVDPPARLVTDTLESLSARLERQWRERRRITRLLMVAAAVSLPVILSINAVLISIVYGLLTRLLPGIAATTATVFVASSLFMGVSLAYATLPLLASFGFRLRERFT